MIRLTVGKNITLQVHMPMHSKMLHVLLYEYNLIRTGQRENNYPKIGTNILLYRQTFHSVCVKYEFVYNMHPNHCIFTVKYMIACTLLLDMVFVFLIIYSRKPYH